MGPALAMSCHAVHRRPSDRWLDSWTPTTLARST